MKIAICDDDPQDLQRLVQYCMKYAETLPVECFGSGKQLLQGFKKEFYDIVFLDIEMGQPNGYETALQLMERERKPAIIFTTQNLNYAVRGYGVALRYLPKPISYEMFAPVLRLALDKVLPKRVSISCQGDTKVLDVSKIMYLEALRHQVHIYMNAGERISIRATLAEMMDQIGQATIVQIHRSYCINLDYVDRAGLQEVELTNGEHLPISRQRRGAFHRQLGEYLKGNHLNEFKC